MQSDFSVNSHPLDFHIGSNRKFFTSTRILQDG